MNIAKVYIILFTAIILGGCDFPSREIPEEKRETPIESNLEIVWSSEEYEEMGFPVMTQPIIENDLVFMVKGTSLVCSNLLDGKKVWEKDLGITSTIMASNIPSDEDYLYLYHNWIKKFEKQTGELVWERPLPLNFPRDLTLMDQTSTHILLGGYETLLKINKESGDFDLEIKVDHLIPQVPVESYSVANAIFSFDGFIYAPVGYYIKGEAEQDGNLLCFDEKTGKLKWGFSVPKNQPGKSAVSGCAIYDNLVIFSAGQLMYCLNRFTGEKVWERYFSDDAFAVKCNVFEDKIFIGSSAEPSVYCISATTGEVLWRTKTNGASVMNDIISFSNGKVYLCDGAQILILDIHSGELLTKAWPPEFKSNNFFIYCSELAIGEGHMVNVGSRKVYCMKQP